MCSVRKRQCQSNGIRIYAVKAYAERTFQFFRCHIFQKHAVYGPDYILALQFCIKRAVCALVEYAVLRHNKIKLIQKQIGITVHFFVILKIVTVKIRISASEIRSKLCERFSACNMNLSRACAACTCAEHIFADNIERACVCVGRHQFNVRSGFGYRYL